MIAPAYPQPQFSEQAEVAVIGGMLINRQAVDEVVAVVTEREFYRESHRRIFRAIAALASRGDPVDMLTVRDELTKTSELEAVGGVDYLTAIWDAVPTAANIAWHVGVVLKNAGLRRLSDVGREIDRAANASDADPESVLADGLAKMLATHRNVGRGYVSAGDGLIDVMAEIEREQTEGRSAGIKTGIPKVDHMTGGLQAGDMVVLAARPSMGKTALAVQMGIHASRLGHHVLFASLEMPRRQLQKRAIVMLSRTPIEFGGHDLDRRSAAHARAANELHALPLRIDERPGETAETLRAGLQRAAAIDPPELVIVDYLQLLEGKGENRVQQVGQISRALKLLARDLSCPVLALSQLSRGVENRHPPRPILSDLRDTGAIEQDADVVFLLWRPEYYFTNDTKPEIREKFKKKAELIVAKQRNGPTGSLDLHWEERVTTFTELAS